MGLCSSPIQKEGVWTIGGGNLSPPGCQAWTRDSSLLDQHWDLGTIKWSQTVSWSNQTKNSWSLKSIVKWLKKLVTQLFEKIVKGYDFFLTNTLKFSLNVLWNHQLRVSSIAPIFTEHLVQRPTCIVANLSTKTPETFFALQIGEVTTIFSSTNMIFQEKNKSVDDEIPSCPW